MAAERALAIVVRGTDWSETSRITTLFTREHGKIRALAKGGRRLKSNFDVAFDLLTVCQVMFLRKAHGGLDLLTEARLEEQFPALRQNLPALYAGYYVAELLADGTQDYDPHAPLFDAAIETLRSLGGVSADPTPLASLAVPPGPVPGPVSGASRGPGQGEGQKTSPLTPPSFPGKGAGGLGSSSPSLQGGGRGVGSPGGGLGPSSPSSPASAAAVSGFELVWLRELGYSPRLDACAACERELGALAGPVFYSPSAGGILCPQCGPGVPDRRGLSRAGLESLRALSEGDSTPALSAESRGEVRQVLGQTVSCVLGRRPRLLWYVDGR